MEAQAAPPCLAVVPAAASEAPPSCQRKLDLVRVLDEPVPLETLPTVEDALAQAPKKMTPRKKKLATKVKKVTPTKAGKLKA